MPHAAQTSYKWRRNTNQTTDTIPAKKKDGTHLRYPPVIYLEVKWLAKGLLFKKEQNSCLNRQQDALGWHTCTICQDLAGYSNQTEMQEEEEEEEGRGRFMTIMLYLEDL
jgi:hypothetical protein